MYRIEMLPARQGDALWIEYGPSQSRLKRILIDGGVVGTYETLRKRIAALPESQREFELIVLTHVDRDHVEGLIKLLADESLDLRVGDVWYNGWRHLRQLDLLGPLQGQFLGALLERRGLPWNRHFDGGPVVVMGGPRRVSLPGGMEITLLSPDAGGLSALRREWTKKLERAKRKYPHLDPYDLDAVLEFMYEKRRELVPRDLLGEEHMRVEELARRRFREDDSAVNGSSIAFIATYRGKSCLFAGDAHPSVVLSGLRRLGRVELEALKLSHHGSKGSTSPELLRAAPAKRFLISTDGSYYSHPDDETLARVLTLEGPKKLCFNYARDVYRQAIRDRWDTARVHDRYRCETVFAEPVELAT